jgi:hypothetical protein
MWFPGNIHRRCTGPEINRVLPGQRGVFGIYNEHQWLVIGSSEDIRASLIDHWETNAQLDRLKPTGFTFELTHTARLREALLIAELKPSDP